MMHSSSKNQKQTHILSKFRPPAPSIERRSFYLTRLPKKRLSIVTLGIVAGLSLPAIAIASQQQSTQSPAPEASRTDISPQLETSSSTGEVFSSSTVNMQVESAPDDSEKIVGEATINGEKIPLVNGSHTTRSIEGDSNSVDIDISVNNSDSSASISSSSSTEIHVDSYESDDDETNSTRGSPRR